MILEQDSEFINCHFMRFQNKYMFPSGNNIKITILFLLPSSNISTLKCYLSMH